jgi:predicted flavoprotein YhiN
MSTSEVTTRLSAPRGKSSLATHLRKKLNLTPAGIGLMQEAALALGDPLTLMPMHELAGNVNSIPVLLISIAPIGRAISTAGGISFNELDADYMIRRLPGVFAAGEMLDWEAPTGGYLLQASFATGAAAGRGALKWLEKRVANSE